MKETFSHGFEEGDVKNGVNLESHWLFQVDWDLIYGIGTNVAGASSGRPQGLKKY